MAHLQVLAVLLGIIVGASSQQIRRPPIITYPITTTYVYNTSGSNVMLNCSADGDPKPTYKWLQNETVVVPSSIITFNTATGQLSINGFTYREAATYICVASNVFDNGLGGRIEVNSWSARIRLLQSRIDRFGGSSAIGRSGPQYNYIRLDCNGQNAAVGSTIIYNWYQSNRQGINMYGDRLFVDQMGNLHFTYLLQNDVIPNGYFCGISTGNENYIQLGTQYNLQVTASSSTGAITPQGQYSNNNVKGLLYTSVKLECVFSGYDPNPPNIPTIQWFDDANVQITANSKYNFSMAGRVMTISNVLEQDERHYFCKARNIAGEASMDVYLNVTSGPIFVNGRPSDQTVPENTDAQFTCDTRSAVGETPPAPPVWRINGVLMGSQTDAQKMYLSADGKTLNIRSVKKNTDIMCIQCFVSNDIDSVLANACLNVILPITLVTAPKLVQPIYLGDRVNLTITARTDPSMTLNYKWIIKNVTYEGNNLPTYVVYDPNTMVAYIDTKGMTETQFRNVLGVYRRVIYNTYETKNVDIDVIQAGAQVNKSGFDLWIIGLIVALILLIIIILIIVFIICRKKQEGDYNVDKKETGAGLDPEKELKDKEFNAYSTPTYDEYYNYPDTKPPGGDPEMDDTIIGDDESLGEYGKEDITHFNEDGSFIGIYQSKKPPPLQPAESSI